MKRIYSILCCVLLLVMMGVGVFSLFGWRLYTWQRKHIKQDRWVRGSGEPDSYTFCWPFPLSG